MQESFHRIPVYPDRCKQKKSAVQVVSVEPKAKTGVDITIWKHLIYCTGRDTLRHWECMSCSLSIQARPDHVPERTPFVPYINREYT